MGDILTHARETRARGLYRPFGSLSHARINACCRSNRGRGKPCGEMCRIFLHCVFWLARGDRLAMF